MDLWGYRGYTPDGTGDTALRTEKRPGRAETQAGRGFQSDVYWWPGRESNPRHGDFQSLQPLIASLPGFTATPCKPVSSPDICPRCHEYALPLLLPPCHQAPSEGMAETVTFHPHTPP